MTREAGSATPLPRHVTSYVGRDVLTEQASRMLPSVSVLTLTGPGGVGKTRLATHLAATVRDRFTDETVFVSLAELHQPQLLASTVAEALGLGDQSSRPPMDLLVDGLRGRRMLLVLDNCEHLLEGCARLVEAIMLECPGVVVLATSRQSLGVVGEQVLPVPPLEVPHPDQPLDQQLRSAAVRLFVDRATAVVSSFAITGHNTGDIVRLCRRLEGLPLAIELAAVRVRALSVGQIADRLDAQLTLLTGGWRSRPDRHETLRALIDWSFRLCTGTERTLWARVSVFAGSFELDAAEEVCSGDGIERDEVVELIDSLVDKSILLRVEHHTAVRYRLLETIRQYGQQKLDTAGQSQHLRSRHRDWYLRMAQRFQQSWLGPHQLAWSRRLRREHANLRAALEFCTSDPDGAAHGLRMAVQLKEFWLLCGGSTEARLHLRTLLDAAGPDAPERAQALWCAAFFALVQGDLPAYAEVIEQAATAAEDTGDESARGYTRLMRGYEALIGNRMSEAAALFDAATTCLHNQQDRSGQLWARYNHGIATALAGDLDHGRQILHDCVDAYTALGEIFWRSWALWSLAVTEYLAGDLARARQVCRETFLLERQVQDRVIVAFALTASAGIAVHSGQYRRASTLFGAAAAAWDAVGASPARYVAFIEPMDKDTELVVGQIGREVSAARFAEGYALAPAAAITYALDDQPAGEPDNPLTARERQVAELVAQGLSNRQIAGRLVIAQRTAETHVDHIMTKLSFNTRAQIAAWFTRSSHEHTRGG